MAKPKDSSSGVYWNSLTRGPILLKKLGKTHLLNCIKSLVGYNQFRNNNKPYKLDTLLVMAWEAGRRGLPLPENYRLAAIESSKKFNDRPVAVKSKETWQSIGERDPRYDGWDKSDFGLEF